MPRRTAQRAIAFANRRIFYWFQRSTGWRIDRQLEEQLRNRADRFLAQQHPGQVDSVATHLQERFDFSDSSRYSLVRDDIYRRFVASEDGIESDVFGRQGRWIPRGCRIFLDRTDDVYIKVFDDFFCAQGEGRFLPDALEKGVYDFLCPALAYLIVDNDEQLRGYAIRSGRILSLYEFERYVEVALKDVICEITRETELYFYDLTFHNFILRDGEISLIDLESVLPLSWYGKDMAFSREMFEQVDIGFPIQKKFLSPSWYAKYVEELNEVPGQPGEPDHRIEQ